MKDRMKAGEEVTRSETGKVGGDMAPKGLIW